jgi:uncharacterized protein YjiS (DUF1127 family)
MNIRQLEETLEHPLCRRQSRRAWRIEMETIMGLTFFRRYFRARNVYWSVVRELSYYTDRELHDIGIDRADIADIARTAAAQA